MVEATLSREILQILKQKGIPQIFLRSASDDLYSFSRALSDAVHYNVHGPYVDTHTPEELREHAVTTFLSRDKRAGVAVWPDGNIGAVFKDERSKNKQAIGELILTAINAGGIKLDCFDGFLRHAYAQFGFIPVAKVRFDPEFAPEGWQSKFGTPDVIFWRHCGDSVKEVAKKIGTYPTYSKTDIEKLLCFDSYEEAYQYRDEQIRNYL